MKLKKDEIYPAPVVPEAVPPSEEVLLALLSGEIRPLAPVFSLANVYARGGRFGEAVELYKEALKLPEAETLRAELNTNLGVALIGLEKLDEALNHFRQAILSAPQKFLAHVYAGRVQRSTGDLDAAAISFEKALKLEPEFTEGLIALGEISSRRAETDAARDYFERAVKTDPKSSAANRFLALAEFERGKKSFVDGNPDAAFAIWSDAFKNYSSVFTVDQEIIEQFAELIKKESENGGLQQRLKLHEDKLLANPDDQSEIYSLFSYFLFTQGLVGEGYERAENLEEQKKRWAGSISKTGEHPYPHFRLGLIAAYQARLELADSELRNCQDKLPPKKQATLKLAALIQFVGELKDMQRRAKEGAIPTSEDWDWEKAGFDNPFETKSWKNSGLLPDQAALWREAGFTALQAKDWTKHKIDIEEARRWAKSDLREGKLVKRWIRAQVGPNEASAWMKFFGSNVEQAIQSRSAGFTDPELAAKWLTVVLLPWDAIRWHEMGYTPEQAVEWQAEGVNDPNVAKERGKTMKELAEEVK